MVSLNTPLCDFGWKAIDFNLQGVDDTFWNLEKSKGENGLLVMFICNHCPYVKAILPRLVHDLRILKEFGIETIAIQSNDPLNYPEDSFENMKSIAHQSHFSFPCNQYFLWSFLMCVTLFSSSLLFNSKP